MAQQKGLGRGLGALLGDYNQGPEADGSLRQLPLQKVEPNPDQPRRDFNEEELQALADSIGEHGILQPLTVREMPHSGYYQIIAGERRWRAARMAGLTEVPALVIEADDRQAMELALIENLQRQDLNPVEEAQGYHSLLEDYGLTQEEAARRVGKSRPAVANALRLLNLEADILEQIRSGALGFCIYFERIGQSKRTAWTTNGVWWRIPGGTVEMERRREDGQRFFSVEASHAARAERLKNCIENILVI